MAPAGGMGEKEWWAASSCFGTVASNCSKKKKIPIFFGAIRSGAQNSWFCAPDLCASESALASPARKGRGAEWLGLVLCVSEHSHNSPALELGCFQPALLCQALLIQDMCWEFFHWEGEALLLSPLLCLVASLGASNCRGHPALCEKARKLFPIPMVSVLFHAAELKNDKKTQTNTSKKGFPCCWWPLLSTTGMLIHLWCWPHGLPCPWS